MTETSHYIFQQYLYEAKGGRHKLVILINREIEVAKDYMGSEFYKEFIEIIGLESMIFNQCFYCQTKFP
jgi:hypothetical protein